ncbi:MAG: NRDE family protein [Bacteroidota bacterium]
MCTVSFVRHRESHIITSNRDEHIARPISYAPKQETIKGCKVVFPKDPKAGGTWFAVNENGVVSVLLNGAFKKHTYLGNYSRSRGLVLLDVITNKNPTSFALEMNLEAIEPFTLVIFQQGKLNEFRWDGEQRYLKALKTSENHIWSSVTLYDQAAIQYRESLFSKFVTGGQATDPNTIADFHSNNHGDFENGFIIDRNNGLKTFSMTQAIIDTDETVMKHIDLINGKEYAISIFPNPLVQSIT